MPIRLKGIPSSKQELVDVVTSLDDIEAIRFVYSLMLGDVFSRLALLEDAFVAALWSSSRIRVLGIRTSPHSSKKMIEKRSLLKGMTFGNLISILRQNATRECDISYLNYVKRNRDYFIHKFFADHPAPGDLSCHEAEIVFRRLRFLDLTFWRASRRIWLILGYNGFSMIKDLGSAGILAMNDLSDFDQHQPSANT